MKILFFQSHPMWIHGLPNGFKDLGHEVLVSGPISRYTIPKFIKDFKPDLVITIGWTDDLTKLNTLTIKRCTKVNKIPHIYWSTEDPTHTLSYSSPLVRRMKPDFIFTICKDRIEYFNNLGFKAAHLDFGFHQAVHNYTGTIDAFKHQIALVANGYSNILKIYPNHYRIQSLKTLVAPLVKANIRVDFYGSSWENISFILGCDIPQEWIHGPLDYTLANKVYSSCDIILGVQNHLTQLTQRTYEILGSKGFLLTSDTPIIRSLFTPGKDLVTSSTPEETVKLVQYYLNNKQEREKIRNHGEKTVQIHHYKNRAQQILDTLSNNNII